MDDLNRAITERNWDEAVTKLADLAKLLPQDQREGLDLTRFNILIGKKNYSAAYKLAEKLSDLMPSTID